MSEQIQTIQNDEISLKDLMLKIKEWGAYLKTQWWKIAIAGTLGGIIGFLYTWIQPVIYTAKTTFIVEESKGVSSLGGLASLAGQFGMDFGGGSGSGGLISGENILLYFKSESLAKEVLLSPYSRDSSISIAKAFAKSEGLLKKWSKVQQIGTVDFPVKNTFTKYSRLQDSLLTIMINDYILKKNFSISKIDRKAGFIQVLVHMKDESLAKQYCDLIVKIAVSRYVDLKTSRQQKNVEKLQSRADSIASLLNKRTASSAKLQTDGAIMDLNPLYRTGRIMETEITTRDKGMLSAVYGEVVKNLEIAKFSLSQETPVIQIVDQSNFPLFKTKNSRVVAFISFFIFGLLASIVFYLTKFYLKQIDWS